MKKVDDLVHRRNGRKSKKEGRGEVLNEKQSPKLTQEEYLTEKWVKNISSKPLNANLVEVLKKEWKFTPTHGNYTAKEVTAQIESILQLRALFHL